ELEDSLGVGAAVEILERHELGLQLAQQPRSMPALAALLLGVVAHDVATSPFPIADDDLLDAQVAHDLAVPNSARDELLAHLAAACDGHADDVLAAPERELSVGARSDGGAVTKFDGRCVERDGPAGRGVRGGPVGVRSSEG